MDKRGQELTTNTVILIILAVIVLVILVLGFTIGWNRFIPFISKTNVDQIVSACDNSCSLSNQYDYCSIKRSLNAEDKSLKDVTCNYLSKEQPKYTVKVCQTISCDNIVFVQATSQENLQTKCSGNEGKTLQALVNDKLLTYDCPVPAT